MSLLPSLNAATGNRRYSGGELVGNGKPAFRPGDQFLKRRARGGYGKAFVQKLIDRKLLNAFLNTKFVIQEVVGESAGAAIDLVKADSVAIAIGANQPYGQFCN